MQHIKQIYIYCKSYKSSKNIPLTAKDTILLSLYFEQIYMNVHRVRWEGWHTLVAFYMHRLQPTTLMRQIEALIEVGSTASPIDMYEIKEVVAEIVEKKANRLEQAILEEKNQRTFQSKPFEH